MHRPFTFSTSAALHLRETVFIATLLLYSRPSYRICDSPLVASDTIGDLWSGSVLRWLAEGRAFGLAASVSPKLRLLFSGLSPKRSK